eukprot:TRINITY_DN15805_c0_g1_i1.p1 TRINITY_DN15805_c0_g1~~TRINITY_DN15805_c0_g1_i1.p1  ORF type:complete len:612 (-),score=69.53 TRINITY_DN15805_c0_g1_i1:374-2209(-)
MSRLGTMASSSEDNENGELEVELTCWPVGRVSRLIGSIPIGFTDHALEIDFCKSQQAALHTVLRNVAFACTIFLTVNLAQIALSIGLAGMSHYKMMYLLAGGLPFYSAAAIPRLFKVPAWTLPGFLAWTQFWMLLASRARFAFIFAGADAQTVFEDPDFPQVSDAANVTNICILVVLYFVVLPVRAKLSLVMLPIVPSLYLAITLPVPGLEGPNSSRKLVLALKLLILTIAGLMARVRFESQERQLFAQLAAAKSKFVKERVLRYESEHRQQVSETKREAESDKHPRNESHNEVQSAKESSATSGNLSSLVLTPTAGEDVNLQLRAMIELASMENWLLHTEDLQVEAEVLGRGGFGIVLRGQLAGGCVAVKTHTRLLSTSQQMTVSVGRELRALRNLRHPCVVSFYGAVIDLMQAEIFMVEELIHGESLKTYINCRPDGIADSTKRNFLFQLISTLAFLHGDDRGIIHGDIKPSNVMITTSLNVKLIDFGLSWKAKSHLMTRCGSLSYMSPELLLGFGLSYAADMFAFGRLVYFVATSHEPLKGVPREELVELARRLESPSLHWGSSTFEACCKDLANACCSTESERIAASSAVNLIESWQLPNTQVYSQL